jgi:hypothetical protein
VFGFPFQLQDQVYGRMIDQCVVEEPSRAVVYRLLGNTTDSSTSADAAVVAVIPQSSEHASTTLYLVHVKDYPTHESLCAFAPPAAHEGELKEFSVCSADGVGADYSYSDISPAIKLYLASESRVAILLGNAVAIIADGSDATLMKNAAPVFKGLTVHRTEVLMTSGNFELNFRGSAKEGTQGELEPKASEFTSKYYSVGSAKLLCAERASQ